MNCRYCASRSVGINYRPSPSMENIYTCSSHATSLFISFTGPEACNGKTKLERAFQRLIDSILAELNLLKGEALRLEREVLKLREEEAMQFRLNSELVSPYIVVAVDEELILSTFVKRLKDRTEKIRIYSEKKQENLKSQTEEVKPKQAASSDSHNIEMKQGEDYLSFKLKIDKQELEAGRRKKVNALIHETCLVDKGAWLEKKMLARLGKKP